MGTDFYVGGTTVTGTGHGWSYGNQGVTVSGGAVLQGTYGMTVTGTGSSNGSDANFGVNITDSNTMVYGHFGVTLHGTGGGSGSWNYGIGIQAGAAVSGLTAGCQLTGIGSRIGAGVMNDGIFLWGARMDGFEFQVTLDGTGGGGSSAAGVGITNGSSISSFSGPITVTGRSQNGSSGDGVDVTGASRITIDHPTSRDSVTLSGSASHGQNVLVDPTSTVS